MANWDGLTPNPITRWASQVEWDDPTQFPLGVCTIVRNMRYRAETIVTRYGWKTFFGGALGAQFPITATEWLRYLGIGTQSLLLAYDSGGNLWYEQGAGRGTMTRYQNLGSLVSPAASRASIEVAFNRAYIALHNGSNGTLRPIVVDAVTNQVSPLGDKQMGVTWTGSTKFRVGNYCSPRTPNGHLYRCIQEGQTAGGQPAFPTGTGATVADGSVIWKEDTVSFADWNVAGNICAGLRWMIVLFMNSNGNIMGYSAPAAVSATLAGSKQILVSNLPIGPANTAARICCFTVAGDSSEGLYFYINSDDYATTGGSGTGILQTATRINDNVTASAVFNFLDTYITGASEATQYAKEIEPPPCLDIYYSRALNLNVYSGINTVLPPPFGAFNLLSGHILSDPSFPERLMAPDNILQVGDTDGERAWCWREFGQMQISCKENSFFQIQPIDGIPAKWPVINMWRNIGICGPNAIDIQEDFFAFAHESGGYRHPDSVTGLPTLITLEIQQTWKRINWTAGAIVWVKIDDVQKEVLFGVPLDNAVSPSHILRCSYLFGWEDPIVFSVRQGRYIPNAQGRKWSIDPIPTQGACIYKQHPLAIQADNQIQNRQFAILHADKSIKILDPTSTHDENATHDKVPIDCLVRPAWIPNVARAWLQFRGCTVSALGSGKLNVSKVFQRKDLDGNPTTQVQLITQDDNNPSKHLIQLSPGGEKTFDIQDIDRGELFAVQFDNGNVIDAWFELHTVTLYTRVLMKARVG